MGDMPRPRPPYLLREKTRHGTVVWYVRRGAGPRIRVRGEFGTAEFQESYEAALSGRRAQPQRAAPGTLAWLLEQYKQTTAWNNDISEATRRQRDNIFKHVLASAGGEPIARITRATIVAGKERRSSTPAQARNFLDAMRGLFRWALEAGHVRTDPTNGVRNPARAKGEGFAAWTEEDVERYEARWPLGTKERVWLAVLLYTGLRKGDAVTLGRQHVRNGIATLRTEKSQKAITVTLPILPVLEETLRAGPCGDLTYICGESRRPVTKESFGNMFREACNAAGVTKSAHGVRKIAATRAANKGATVAQLEAIFGWIGGGMASLYTRQADRERLAREAMHKLMNEKSAGTAENSL